MASFLIYVPREHHPESSLTEAILAAVGLADLAPAETANIGGGLGPDGKGGTLIGWTKPGRIRFHIDPAEQTWFPAVKSGDLPPGRYWVGVWNDSPPTAADLLRPYPYRGKLVELAGQNWTVPLPKNLPTDAILADDGTWRFELQRRFHAYGIEVDQWLERRENGTLADATFTEVFGFALRALSLNYRLTPELASRMVLFGGEEGAQVAVCNVLFAALGVAGE